MHPIVTDYVRREVTAAYAPFQHYNRVFALKLWKAEDEHKVLADLCIKRTFEDLFHLQLMLLDAAGEAMFAYLRELGTGEEPRGPQRRDTAAGFTTPMLDMSEVTRSHFTVKGGKGADRYKHLLALSWSAQATPSMDNAVVVDDAHVSADPAGKGRGLLRVRRKQRERLTVIRAGGAGYAFGRCDVLPGRQIFLDIQEASDLIRFEVGQKLTAVITLTPRGLQGRAIQPA